MRGITIAIVALLAAYTAPMVLVPVAGPDGVVAAAALQPGRDFGSAIDRAVLPGHLWSKSKTWDPEGLVSTLPAAASLLDRKSTRLNSSHIQKSRMPSSA